jgi:RHH-type proline utilization regulon transcriptional repressor/proline dehydrogenase/delta 1-pyrroline-5-carboxylate dehydrogenase
MGGKNAIIVDSGADLDEAVLGVTASAFGFQGQKCSACSRVILVGAAYEPFLRRLLDAIESLRIGYPEEPETEVGPVIEAAAQRRILGVIADAARDRPPLLSREVSSLAPGYFVGPTLFDEVHPESPLAQEEIFGPVLAVLRAGDFSQALAMANNTRFALTGGVFSRNPLHLERAALEFHVGNLYLNRGITGALVGRQPFGGFRLSGVGSKAGGPDYLLQFMEPRTVTENTLRRGYAPAEPGPGGRSG